MKFRSSIALAAGAAIAVGLVGCTGGGGDNPAPTNDAANCQGTPQAGGTLTVAKQNETVGSPGTELEFAL